MFLFCRNLFDNLYCFYTELLTLPTHNLRHNRKFPRKSAENMPNHAGGTIEEKFDEGKGKKKKSTLKY